MICIARSVEGGTFPVGRFPRPPQLQLTLADQEELILRRKINEKKRAKNKYQRFVCCIDAELLSHINSPAWNNCFIISSGYLNNWVLCLFESLVFAVSKLVSDSQRYEHVVWGLARHRNSYILARGDSVVCPSRGKFSQWQRDKRSLEVLIEIKPEDPVDLQSIDMAIWRKRLDSLRLAFMGRLVYLHVFCFCFFHFFAEEAVNSLTHRHIPGDMAVWKVTSLLSLPSSLIYSRPHVDVLRQNPHN